jgi:hypothetical protein
MYVFTQIQIAEAASRMIKQRRGEPRNSATETEGGSVQAYMQTSSVRLTLPKNEIQKSRCVIKLCDVGGGCQTPGTLMYDRGRFQLRDVCVNDQAAIIKVSNRVVWS